MQPGEPIALNRLAELAEQDNSTCESKLKQLISSNQISGKYSDFSQVFILGETTLFCQIDGGNFPNSLAHHTCPSCGRYICGRCIGQLMAVGLVACAYCDTEFDPKPVIEVMTSSKDLKVRSYGECLILMDEGNYEAAVEAFKEYLKDNEDDASGWFDLTYSLFWLERYNEAIKCWEKADKIRPEHVATLYNWGNTLGVLGRSEEAIQKYQQANEIEPEHAATLNNWGNALHHLGRYGEAIQKYQQANEIEPEDADTLYNWGVALEQLKRFKEAKKMYQRAATAARTAGDISSAEKYEKWVKEVQS